MKKIKNILFKCVKIFFIIILVLGMSTTTAVHAEYYLVGYSSCDFGCPIARYHHRVHHYHPKHRYVHHFRRVIRVHHCGACRSCGYVASPCGGGLYMPGYVDTHQVIYDPYDPDLTTGDDNPMLDPDMDIDH